VTASEQRTVPLGLSRTPTSFFGEAVLMMELPKRHSTPSEGGRFAPIWTPTSGNNCQWLRQTQASKPAARGNGHPGRLHGAAPELATKRALPNLRLEVGPLALQPAAAFTGSLMHPMVQPKPFSDVQHRPPLSLRGRRSFTATATGSGQHATDAGAMQVAYGSLLAKICTRT
jgi:hypothetical protein